MEQDQILENINKFPRWHYQFDLKGNLTPIFDPAVVNRHKERKLYFFDPLVQFCGGSLAGKRVLDLGCNAGFWSLAASLNGADYVLGIDGRSMHVDQARFVFDVHEVPAEKYQFILGNLFEQDFAAYGQFDVVLCLGLLYHVSKPILLMEKIDAISPDLLVIDTDLSVRPGSCFDIRHEQLDDPRNSVEYEMILRPTRQAVLDLVGQFGYHARVLKPEFASYEGSEVYRDIRRRAFICAKQSDLRSFPAPNESAQEFETRAKNIKEHSRPSLRRFLGKTRRRLFG